MWRDQPYGFKSDVWSLGCILYEMTCLRAPFQAHNMEGLYKRVIKGQYHRIPPTFSPELSSLIKVLLAVDPASRPSIDEVLNMKCMKQRGEPMKKLTTSLLIETIKDPKDFQSLKHVLPKANFDDYQSV